MNKSLILNRIKIAYSLKNDAELARFLEIQHNTLSNWYSRNTIDYDKVFLKCELLNFDWLITGDGEMLKNPEIAVSPSQPQENDNEIISLLRDKIALLESNNQLQQDKIAYLEQRLELAELKDKEAMALKIKKQRKEIDQKDEIINLQNEELDAMKSISLPPNKPLHPSKRV